MNTATELAATYFTAFDAAAAILKTGTGNEPELDTLDDERDRALEALAATPARSIEELKAKAAVAAREDQYDLDCEVTAALRRSIWEDIANLGH